MEEVEFVEEALKDLFNETTILNDVFKKDSVSISKAFYKLDVSQS